MRKISLGLSVREVQAAIKEIKAYQNDLNRKCEDLCRQLTEESIGIAQAHIDSSEFGKYIHLDAEITSEKAGCKAILYMEDTTKINSEWQTKEGVRSAQISPTLMLEFGSGLKAENPISIPGMDTGTVPGGKHGTEPGWYYMDLGGSWHYSSGISSKMPIYHAGKELRDKVVVIVKKVFK